MFQLKDSKTLITLICRGDVGFWSWRIVPWTLGQVSGAQTSDVGQTGCLADAVWTSSRLKQRPY